MQYMFFNCSSLLSLDLRNLNTSSVSNMSHMFFNCSSLLSLNLNHFVTSSVNDMRYMFSNCNTLKSLFIDNFNMKSIEYVDFMFSNCSSLYALNLTNFNFSSASFNKMFDNCNPNLKYCIDNTKIYIFRNLLNEYENNCTDVCINYNSKKYIKEENLCVDSCTYKNYTKNDNNICKIESPIGPSNYKGKNKFGIIIGIISGIVTIIIIFILIIFLKIKRKCCFKKGNIKISFKNIEKVITEMEVEPNESITDLINIFCEKTGIANNNTNSFLYKKENKKENIVSQKTPNPTVKDLIPKNSDVDILSIYVEPNIKIIFNENNTQSEINISIEKTMSNIVDMYYEIKGIPNDKQKLFISNHENIDSDKNKNKKIKDYIRKDSENKILNISVHEKKEFQRINYRENSFPIFEIYLSKQEKVSILFDIYYEKKGIKNQNQKFFLCGGDVVNPKNMINIENIQKNIDNMEILVYDNIKNNQ